MSENLTNTDLNKLEVMLDPGAYMPDRAHETDAGLDLFAPDGSTQWLWAGNRTRIDTGVHVAIPRGYVGKIEAKSSLMVQHGILTAGTIDSGYTGSINVMLFHAGKEPLLITPGRKIAHLVIYPIITPEPVIVDKMPETERGDAGFGSTGATAKEVPHGEV